MLNFGLSEERAGTVIDMPSHMGFTLPKYEYRECKLSGHKSILILSFSSNGGGLFLIK
jgi:hypothetical protein